MSMTKRYLESLPEAEQNEILGNPYEEAELAAAEAGIDPDYEAWLAQREALVNRLERERIIDGQYEISDADPGL